MPHPRRVPRVAVWIETSRAYGRGLIRGVANYVRQHGPWSIYFTPHGLREPLSRWLNNWDGDAILARIDDQRMATALLARQRPLIDLRGRIPNLNIPVVGLDNRAVSRMAFEHLLERGFRHYGFFGFPQGEHVLMDQRCEAFVEAVEDRGCACDVYDPDRRRRRKLPDWTRQQKSLGKWLLGLPKPIGIMCANDDFGQQLMDACRGIGVNVPEEVAVIGVDNDEELCNLSTPPLTSIVVNADRIGFRAAALLDRIVFSRAKAVPQELLYPPSHVITRLSTDTLAVEDPVLARALRFIRERACDGIRVGDVVTAAVTSRRYLEREMRDRIGRSPNQEILRVRLHHAKLLLLETDMSLDAIAHRTGFRSHKYFGDAFVRCIGQPPAEFRRQARSTLES